MNTFTTLAQLAAGITAAWTTATELAPLLMVPAAVWLIRLALEAADRLAAAARATYRAGLLTGRIAKPLIWRAADGLSWALAQIDWAEVVATVRAGLIALAALLVVAAREAQPLLVRLSAALGRRYAALVVAEPLQAAEPTAELVAAAVPTPETEPMEPAAPAAPEAPADLAPLPVSELRRRARAAGLPRSLTRNGRRAALLEALSVA